VFYTFREPKEMKLKNKIAIRPTEYHLKRVIEITGEINDALSVKLKEYPDCYWYESSGTWIIPAGKFDLEHFFSFFSSLAYIDYSAIKGKETMSLAGSALKYPETKPIAADALPSGYLEKLQQCRYSENTIKTYVHYFRDFIIYFHDRSLDSLASEDINRYLLQLIKEKNISSSQQNQRINSIKFYYEKVLGRKKEYYQIERPRKERKLPDVLSKEEVGAMIKATENLKHKSLIALIYSCGLRRSEAINLKLEDIDSKRMLIKIKGAKGKKDRYVQLSESLLKLIRDYYKEERPMIFLYEGQKGEKYSATSIYNDIKLAATKAGIKKRVYPHILRHSFATHNIEQGIDIRYIQEWLGHESIKTTELYTHVANNNFRFKNLLDDIL